MLGAIIYQLKSLFFIAAGLFGIGLLIGIHEFGHYLFARLFGVRAPSFSIGMGPTLVSKKLWGTDFKISAIPLGGYVEIAGLAEIGQGDQAEALATDSGSFNMKPYWQRTVILLGGIIFNFILAFLIFVVLAFTGMPKSLLLNPEASKPIINTIIKNGVADKSGLIIGDEILQINTIKTPHVLAAITEFQKNANQDITITIKRNNEKINLLVMLDKTGRLGVSYKTEYAPRASLINGFKEAWRATWEITTKTIQGFIHLFKKRSTEGLGGPLTLISELIKNAEQGLSLFLFFLAFISINLAIINLIPIPITDGGQFVFTTIEAVIRRPISEKLRLIVHNISWVLVLALLGFLTIKDSKVLFWDKIKHLFGK